MGTFGFRVLACLMILVFWLGGLVTLDLLAASGLWTSMLIPSLSMEYLLVAADIFKVNSGFQQMTNQLKQFSFTQR